ncbi:MAG TPA: hypothetical protein V6C84_25905 [Coleofasciculaceae cyanobacterium]|jgi:hypothetical protein
MTFLKFKKRLLVEKPKNNANKNVSGWNLEKFVWYKNSLTKAALVKMDDQIETFVDWHHVKNARLADISCLLLHYPFLSFFYEKGQEAVEAKRYGHTGSPLASIERDLKKLSPKLHL